MKIKSTVVLGAAALAALAAGCTRYAPPHYVYTADHQEFRDATAGITLPAVLDDWKKLGVYRFMPEALYGYAVEYEQISTRLKVRVYIYRYGLDNLPDWPRQADGNEYKVRQPPVLRDQFQRCDRMFSRQYGSDSFHRRKIRDGIVVFADGRRLDYSAALFDWKAKNDKDEPIVNHRYLFLTCDRQRFLKIQSDFVTAPGPNREQALEDFTFRLLEALNGRIARKSVLTARPGPTP